MPSDLPRITIRMPQETIDKIKAIADKEHRSANEQINHITEKFIEEYEAEQERSVIKEKRTKPENININKSKGVIAGDNNGTINLKK